MNESINFISKSIAFLENFVSRVYFFECKFAGIKQEIINSVKSKIRGVSAHATEEGKLNVILFNVEEGD